VVAETLAASAIVVFTASGTSALRIARNRPAVPVLALTPSATVRAALALSFGIRAESARAASSANEMVELAIEQARERGMAAPGDRIVITAGVPFGVEGTTNLLWVERVE
jgi:pyruvate kinase